MSVIRILNEDVSNRIAAGEVVERPASIVKELVENSLDAGARRISITVERGGRSLVRVIDDGSGMDSEDAMMCLEAHATSKVRTTEDIENILTMGFRGEAIPSISSVSRFTLRTRPHDQAEGTEVEVSGGTVRNMKSVGCAPGTSISVRNLFFNMPARKKFLRTIQTEEGHISEMVHMLALANPGIGFDLTFDQRPVLSVQPEQDRHTRATMLLGKDLMAAMTEVTYADGAARVSGFVAKPGFTRSSRSDQRVFVNSRPISNKQINFAIRDAYHTLVMKGRFPPILLFVEVATDMVDINVHPSKREVRFRDGRGVSQAVASAIRQALQRIASESVRGEFMERPGTPIPQPPMGDFIPDATAGQAATNTPVQLGFFPEDASIDETMPSQIPPAMAPPAPYVPPEMHPTTDGPLSDEGATPVSAPVDDAPTIPPGTTVSAAKHDEIRNLRVIGNLADSYLLAESADGMVLIDQHAAHERIMFESLLAHAREKDGASQGLLIPITMDVSATDANLLHAYKDDLEKLGFEIGHFGGNTFVINGIPPHFPQENVVGVLNDVLGDLRDSPLRARRADEHKIISSACKAAVKAHDRLKKMEVDALLSELITCELPYTCPHGRPTMIKIDFKELEKRFGRRAP